MNIMTVAGSAAGAGALQGDANWADVKLLIQPHNGETGVAALKDRGPGGRTATIQAGTVAIVDDFAISPLFGAYADPLNARVTYSDDAGLVPAVGGSFTIEALVQPQTSLMVWDHGLYGCGATTLARHIQSHIEYNSNYFYGYDGSIQATFHDNWTVDDAAGPNGPLINITTQVTGSNVCIWWNGHPLTVAATAHLVASNDWSVGWNAFNLFADATTPGAYFSGNLVALRFTHAARMTLGTAFVPNRWGFPEHGA